MPAKTSCEKLRVIRLPEVIVRTGVSRGTVYNKMNRYHPSYDPKFPRSIRLGMKSVGWIESEINFWILSIQESTQMSLVKVSENHVHGVKV